MILMTNVALAINGCTKTSVEERIEGAEEAYSYMQLPQSQPAVERQQCDHQV